MKKWVASVLIAVLLFACNKQKEETFCLEAFISWEGEPAADGLGWVIKVDSSWQRFYIPKNLPENFKTDGRQIAVCLYKTNEKFFCECAVPLDKYFITSIKPR